jgi:MoCo/4Fe-4S cofactor protein with predicted Tat translocation signal
MHGSADTGKHQDGVPERSTAPGLDLEAVRARLQGMEEPETWRSLEELARTPEAQAALRRELASTPMAGYDRRSFLQLMGASLALAGIAGCTKQPLEKIVPYVRQPEEIVPGRPLYFATGMTLGGVMTGLLVESHMGRPTKVEGNPQHPTSHGGTDRFAQASILGLYDPDRSQTVTSLGDISTWGKAAEALRIALGEAQARRGAGVRLLTETVGSPTLAEQIRAFLALYPEARWIQYEPDGRDVVRDGMRCAFGASASMHYDFTAAEVVVALDADFLTSGPGSVRYARDFMQRRRAESVQVPTNRLYAVESMPTGTGAVADHRLPLDPASIVRFLAALAARLGVPGAAPVLVPAGTEQFLAAVAADLRRAGPASALVAGESLPAEAQVLVHGIHAVLGSAGTCVAYTDPLEAEPTLQLRDFATLVDDMHAGHVDLLVVLGANPVLTAPADARFAAAMQRVRTRFHLGLYADETAELCHWHVPAAHYLEFWSDGRAHDGTVGIQQPLIEPLYAGKSAHDVLAVLLGTPDDTGLDLLRAHWRSAGAASDFEPLWRRTLHDGLMPGTACAARQFAVDARAVAAACAAASAAPVASALQLVLRLDPAVHDGRFANNGWLQELPRPLTKLTWDNAALLSPATAQRLGVQSGDVVQLETQGLRAEAPVSVLPGHADECVTVHVGNGRRRAGRVGNGVGFDAFALASLTAPWGGAVQVIPTGKHYTLVTTQEHHDMERRGLVRHATAAEFAAHPEFAHEVEEAPARDESMYPEHAPGEHAWAMAFDLGACTGCNACVVACNAENNVAIVGKDQVRRGREMHWIRIDRYFEGDPENPRLHHQPVNCMQCENAPCEVVCPVAATSHSPEGLNDMAYNRCVGTRYCSNNCPYKVRRFNFYMFTDLETPVLQLMRNPDVTVRTRGVMEKCTYCVQRINHARIDAKDANRPLGDGEIITACQQACPAEAIVFGDQSDPGSRISRLKASPRNYAILASLNTRPRTTYIARVDNPNPELEGPA